MKKLLIIAFFASISAIAQQRVYHRDMFDTEILSQKDAETKYPDLRAIDRKKGSLAFEIDEKKINNDFMRAAIKQDKSIVNLIESTNVPIEIYLNKGGTIDYIVYGYSAFDRRLFNGRKYMFDTLNVKQKELFHRVAENFCKSYKFPSTSESNYKMYMGLGFGKGQKKVSKKYISTIEMAENCTQPDTVKSLALNKLYLDTFPEIVFKFKNLEKLDLSDNYIEQIPKQIWELKKLKQLSLSGNYIDYSNFKFKKNTHLKDLNLQFTGMTKMPRSVKKNRELEILFVGNNKIELRKNDFRRLSNLKALNLYNVRTTYLPKSISKLKNLDELDLYYNDLQNLPKEICQLKNLKTLAVSNNNLWDLPKEIAQMTNLQTLYAHHNRLNNLPTLPNLKLLDIGYNAFKVFPEQVYALTDLEEFDITNNQVDEVPEKLLALKKLQKVYFRGNEFMKVNEKSKEVSRLVADLEARNILVR